MKARWGLLLLVCVLCLLLAQLLIAQSTIHRTTEVFDFINGLRVAGQPFTALSGSGNAVTLGSASTTSVTITTDGTGDGELTVPAGSISGTEIATATINPSNLAATIKYQRVTTGSCAATGCDVTLTWTAAFADTNYTTSCTVQDATAGNENGLQVERVSAVVAASITVKVANLNAAAVTGTLHCLAFHD